MKFNNGWKHYVTISYDNTIKGWDLKTGKLLYSADQGNDFTLSPDSKWFATQSEDKFSYSIKSTQNGEELYKVTIKLAELHALTFSQDGLMFATSSIIADSSFITLWNHATGKAIYSKYSGRANWKIKPLLEFSPDGKLLVTALPNENGFKVWDTKTGNVIHLLAKQFKGISEIIFSPDSKLVLILLRNGREWRTWDLKTGIQVSVFSDDSRTSFDGTTSGTISKNSKYFLGHQLLGGDITKVWDIETGRLLINLRSKSGVLNSRSTFTPDGNYVFHVDTNNALRKTELKTGKVIFTLEHLYKTKVNEIVKLSVGQILLPEAGNLIITLSYVGEIKAWNSMTGQYLYTLRPESIDTQGNVSDITLFLVGDFLIGVPSVGEKASIWSVKSGKLISETSSFSGHSYRIMASDISSDGRYIAASFENKKVSIWETTTGRIIHNLSIDSTLTNAMEFSPDGKYIVTTSYYTESAKVWDVETGVLLSTLNLPSRGVNAKFSPDSKHIITEDGYVWVWDWRNGTTEYAIKGHRGSVNSANYSPDGRHIITASWDSTVKGWESSSGKLIYSLTFTKPVFEALYSPDGKIVRIEIGGIYSFFESDFTDSLKFVKETTSEFYIGKSTWQYSPDGKEINWWKDTVTVSDLNTGEESKHYFPDGKDKMIFSKEGKSMIIASNSELKVYNADNYHLKYKLVAVDSSDHLIVDNAGHYDGTEAARKLLYFTCGTEIIELDQVKDQLWIPNLAERINKGDTINAKTLNELNICGLTPEVEDASSGVMEYNFKITPRRGGLGETVLYVNGIEAKRYKPAQLQKTGGVYQLRLKKEELNNYFVAGKQNPVTVKAYTSDNAISSRGLIVNEDKTKEYTAPPNLYAVMVGVSDYKGDELDLKYAAKDATDISAAISNAAKKLLNTDGKEHVFMYNLTTAKEHYLLPEKNSIKKVLEEIGKKATANDILIIFFAGHGVMTGEGDKKQFYFLSADASSLSTTDAVKDVGISTTELTEWMKPQNIKAQKRILIFDACNSGQAINDIASKDMAVRNDDKAQQIKAIDKLNEKSGLFILSASASNQSAYEMGRYSQGLLTYSLLKAIKQQPDILNQGKYLDLSRWFDAAKESVSDLAKESGARQEPQIVTNTNFNIGVVDEEVMAKIVLPQEKPLFAASNFQNADENITDDNLELSKMINGQLNETSSRGTDSKIIYVTATNSPDAYLLIGRYDVKGEELTVKVNIKQGKEIKYRFEVKGRKDNIKELAEMLVQQATEWILKNK